MAKEYLAKIKKYANVVLHLELNKKSAYYQNKDGIDFCGYRIYETHIKLRKRFKKKLQKSIKIWQYLKDNNKINYEKLKASYNSFKSHAKHANSYTYINKVSNMYKELLDKNFYQSKIDE